MRFASARLLLGCAGLVLACATPEPILYPNATLQANGETRAAAGAAGGLVRGIFRTRRDPDPSYRLFVERCLERKGYEVVGWQ